MQTLEKICTYQTLQEHFSEEVRCEIIANELFMSPVPNTQHQEISRELEFLLYQFVKTHKLGKIFDAPFDVIVDENNVVQPDLLFISNANLHKLHNVFSKKMPNKLRVYVGRSINLMLKNDLGYEAIIGSSVKLLDRLFLDVRYERTTQTNQIQTGLIFTYQKKYFWQK